MRTSVFLFFVLMISGLFVSAQQAPVNRKQFFLNDSVINVQFTTDIRKLRTDKKKPVWLPAHIIMQFADSSVIDENISVEPRGIYRKDNCDIASLMLDFKTTTAPLLSNLKKLKLVGGCRDNYQSEQFLLKEYLVYKIYNILSPLSFRVRLLHITYKDANRKVGPYTQYAFLIEDIKDLAERNRCKEVKNKTYGTEATNRAHITFVSIFQYMIANTDWAVPNYHNVKLLVPLSDTSAKPYVVPYDFDYSGVVNANYAVPEETLGIQRVTDRYYQGHARTMEELEAVLSIFKEKEDTIMQYVNNFDLLKPNERKDITGYINQFYHIIKDNSSVKYYFISKALQ